ncbi:hypothetical protein [Polycladidibacter hongkongensis]|uniref:hypothetical protein n=1 Tax=Polycladidibacter hongkongensis TaxID=1647556 RepID=UPI000832F34B|nr:hypothetical protein [Pseudovibrio hongkongensis]
MLRKTITLIGALVLLAACGPKSAFDSLRPEKLEDLNAKYMANARMLRKNLSGNTLQSWTNGHGTQIEYYKPNGKTYLLYPGNSKILVGDWKTVDSKEGVKVCFRYPGAYNKVTGKYTYKWNCGSGSKIFFRSSEIRKGDVLKLSTKRKLPQKLSGGGQVFIEELMPVFNPGGKLTANQACKWLADTCTK